MTSINLVVIGVEQRLGHAVLGVLVGAHGCGGVLRWCAERVLSDTTTRGRESRSVALPALGGMPDASGDADYYGKSSKRERLLKKNS